MTKCAKRTYQPKKLPRN